MSRFYKFESFLFDMKVIFLMILVLISPMVLSAGCGDGVCDIEDPEECIADCPEEVYDSSVDLPYGEGVFDNNEVSDSVGSSEEIEYSSSGVMIKILVFVFILLVAIGVFVYFMMRKDSRNIEDDVSLERSSAQVVST